jgi:Zn-dependent peptidase ImmA (M78 family)
MAYRRPATQAKQLLEKMGIEAIPVPVLKIAKFLGAVVHSSPLDEELSGLVFVRGDTPIIGVNSLHHENRRRFTIAHEIGHLTLHRHLIGNHIHVDRTFPVLMRDAKSGTGSHLIEREANQFAAALLMPEHKLSEHFDEELFDIDDDEPIERLAKKFQVSKQAMSYRIRNLSPAVFR